MDATTPPKAVLWTYRDFCAALQVGRSTAEAWVSRADAGRGPLPRGCVLRLGRSVRFRAAAVERWLRELAEGG
jgi:predicted DNA-binding transcriptional regulator AlpA